MKDENSKRRQNLATALFSAGLLALIGIAWHNLVAWMFIAVAIIVITVVVGFFLLSEEAKRSE